MYPTDKTNFDPRIGVGSVMVQAGYFGRVSRHLAGCTRPINLFFGPGATVTNEQLRWPYHPQYRAKIGALVFNVSSISR
jgi:hypothetical protein